MIELRNRAAATGLAVGLLLMSAGCATGPHNRVVERADRSTAIRADAGWTGDPVVALETGVVAGYDDTEATFAWRGIPYAAPPVGDLRWKAPLPPEPWDGVLEAKRFGDPCMQYSPIIPGRIVGAEDCLYLNVWRPRTEDADLPVYVWIHGGGNSIGAADFVPDYYGHALASRGNLVFVSINYRLGPFGWLTNPAIRNQADPADASGNYGTLDIIRALEWIQTNIEGFGGDPDRVTVAGESAGGINILSLLISDLAEGLLHRAVVQSGAVQNATVAEGDAASSPLFDRVEDADDPLLAARYLDPKTVLQTAAPASMGMTGAPSVFADGYVVPSAGLDAVLDPDRAADVPLVIGSNGEEVKLFLWFGDDPSWRDELYQAVGKYSSERWKAEGVDAVARAWSSAPDRNPVYAYWFKWGMRDTAGESPLPGNWPDKLGAFHTLEIPFFLGTDTVNGRLLSSLLFNRRNRPGREALSAAMLEYLAGFVHTGDPNARIGTEDPGWEPWDQEPDGPKSIVFDVDGDRPAIDMMSKVFTVPGIYKRMRDELSPELYERTAEYLERGR